jgi:hypothetical protein
MTPQEKKTLQVYYPMAGYQIAEVKTQKHIERYYTSRMAMCWGNGPIVGTDFYKLCHASPQFKGDKQLILVCRMSAIAKIGT